MLTLTKEANANFFLESKAKNFGLKKAYFWGHPVIQAVKAKNAWTFLQKIHIFTKEFVSEKISHFYPLQAEIILFGRRVRSLSVKYVYKK